MIKRVIHAANICGTEDLLIKKTHYENKYLCCSSIDCLDFFHRDVLFLVEGEVVAEFSGDIGCIGFDPKNTIYNELHVINYTVEGLYIPDNMEFFDLRDFAKARVFINDILEMAIKYINCNEEQISQLENFEEEFANMSDEEYKNEFDFWNFE